MDCGRHIVGKVGRLWAALNCGPECRRWVWHDCGQSTGGGWGMIVGRVQEVGVA